MTNKQSPEYIRVREEIAAEIQFFRQGERPPSWSQAVKDMRLEQADSILSIKGIAIEADNQDLGGNISFLLGKYGQGKLYDNYPENFNRIMKLIDNDMAKANFKKVV